MPFDLASVSATTVDGERRTACALVRDAAISMGHNGDGCDGFNTKLVPQPTGLDHLPRKRDDSLERAHLTTSAE